VVMEGGRGLESVAKAVTAMQASKMTPRAVDGIERMAGVMRQPCMDRIRVSPRSYG
jgi:hypothetical protein